MQCQWRKTSAVISDSRFMISSCWFSLILSSLLLGFCWVSVLFHSSSSLVSGVHSLSSLCHSAPAPMSWCTCGSSHLCLFILSSFLCRLPDRLVPAAAFQLFSCYLLKSLLWMFYSSCISAWLSCIILPWTLGFSSLDQTLTLILCLCVLNFLSLCCWIYDPDPSC